LLRNRQVALAFDITDEPFYGKVEGFWIHAEQPVRGCTGCFKFLTISAVSHENKLILGSLPLSRGADLVELILELLQQAKTFVHPEILLFDRGFDNLELLARLQEAHVRYQILWRKQAWATKILKKMKRGEVKEVIKVRKYSKDKSTFKIKVRYVFIKRYRRFANGKAYNWVFATNTSLTGKEIVREYMLRWNIETDFRVQDEARIKTKSTRPEVRLFYFLISCLLLFVWNATQKFEISFKKFLITLSKTEIVKRKIFFE